MYYNCNRSKIVMFLKVIEYLQWFANAASADVCVKRKAICAVWFLLSAGVPLQVKEKMIDFT